MGGKCVPNKVSSFMMDLSIPGGDVTLRYRRKGNILENPKLISNDDSIINNNNDTTKRTMSCSSNTSRIINQRRANTESGRVPKLYDLCISLLSRNAAIIEEMPTLPPDAIQRILRPLCNKNHSLLEKIAKSNKHWRRDMEPLFAAVARNHFSQ